MDSSRGAGSFSSITITTRSLSPKRDCMPYSNSAFSPLNIPDTVPSSMARSENKTLKAIAGIPRPPRHKAVVVTVDECKEHHCDNETPRSPQAPPVHRHSYTMEDEQTDSSPSLKRHIFRSCVYLELLPSKLSRSTLYLDKSLSIPLRQTLYRSTLSFSLGKPSFTQTPEKPRTMIQPKMPFSDWDMANVGVDGKERHSQHLKDGSTINGSAFKKNAGSDSDTLCSTLTSLPFRTRCHSSSAAFRLNGKANDVLGPPQCNLRARQAFSKPSGTYITSLLHRSHANVFILSLFLSFCCSHLFYHCCNIPFGWTMWYLCQCVFISTSPTQVACLLIGGSCIVNETAFSKAPWEWECIVRNTINGFMKIKECTWNISIQMNIALARQLKWVTKTSDKKAHWHKLAE